MDSQARAQIENRVYRDRTDEELMVICEADREAFGELARRYRPLAFRAAFSVLRNALDAEDHVQSAFCKAFAHLGNFERRAKFSTWLLRIVVNECLMHLRQMRQAAFVPLDTSAFESTSVQDTRWSPEAQTERVLLGKLLSREIRRIPPLLRNVFLLRDVQQKSMPEVAAQLGISVEAAKSRLSRAREELRKRLGPQVVQHLTPQMPPFAASDSATLRSE